MHVSVRIILVSLLMLCSYKVCGQKKLEISGGIGFEDGPNVKIKYGKNLKLGLSQTIIATSTAIEIYYHFAGKSEFTDQRPWNINLGNMWHWHLGTAQDDAIYQFVYLRIGRTFNFSEKTGLNLNLGLGNEYGNKTETNFYPYPSFNISYFLRI